MRGWLLLAALVLLVWCYHLQLASAVLTVRMLLESRGPCCAEAGRRREQRRRVRIVVARFAEDVDWLAHPAFAGHEVLIVNKGPPMRGPRGAVVVQRPNVGRCDETYLWYCCAAYDSLPDTTVFLPGSCRAHRGKWRKTLALMELVNGGHATALLGRPSADLRRELSSFRMSEWRCTDPRNRSANAESALLPSPVRPFGAWWDAVMPPGEAGDFVVYQGILAASRESIRSTPRALYGRLRRELATHSNPEQGHYVERAWATLFGRGAHREAWLT